MPTSALSVLDVAGHLLVQADAIRPDHPEVAAALETDSHEPWQRCRAFGQRRPTTGEWIKQWLPGGRGCGRARVRISSERLLVITPTLHEWTEQRCEGRPSRLLRLRFEGVLTQRDRRHAFAARRRAGHTELKPPRRPARAQPAGLAPAEAELLDLIAWLPLVPTARLLPLSAERSQSALQRRVARLRERGLVIALPAPADGAGPRRRLLLPSNLGLAVLACQQDSTPVSLAEAVRATDVGQSLPLPALLTTVGYLESGERAVLGPIWRDAQSGRRRPWPIFTGRVC